jgi:hypothetical protein
MVLNIVATCFGLKTSRKLAASKKKKHALLKITVNEISIISHLVYRLTLKSIILQVSGFSADS